MNSDAYIRILSFSKPAVGHGILPSPGLEEENSLDGIVVHAPVMQRLVDTVDGADEEEGKKPSSEGVLPAAADRARDEAGTRHDPLAGERPERGGPGWPCPLDTVEAALATLRSISWTAGVLNWGQCRLIRVFWPGRHGQEWGHEEEEEEGKGGAGFRE
jgi:hypothetical protein